MSELAVRERQTKAFESLWHSNIEFARFSYNTASPLRLLRYAFRRVHQVRENVRVLDAGFGRGDSLFHFAPSCSLYGLELSDTALLRAEKIARNRGYANFDFRKPESEDLPYTNDFFDVIVLSHVLEHLHDHRRVLNEIARCLRPISGSAYILVPLDDWQPRILSESEMEVKEFWTGDSVHVRRYNTTTLQVLVQECGLRIVDFIAADHLLDWKSSIESRFRAKLRHRLRSVDGFLVAPALNVPLSLIPFPIWNALDRRMQKRGYKARQALIIAQKDC